MISLRDLEWAAGFLEGEGCFHTTYNKKTRVVSSHLVSSSQVYREPLNRLRRIFGGRVYIDKRKLRKSNHSLGYGWYVSGARARGVMLTLFSLLSHRRKMRIRKAFTELP